MSSVFWSRFLLTIIANKLKTEFTLEMRFLIKCQRMKVGIVIIKSEYTQNLILR